MNKCPVSKYCGGCQLQGTAYNEQLKKKQEYIESLLKKFGKVEPIIGMKDPYNYRNKVQVSFGYDEKRQIICGNYVPSSHMIVPVEDCMIADETANRIINSVKKLMIKYKISIFDEHIYKGCMRHLLIRTSNLGEVMLVLVTGSFNIVKKDLFIRDILKYNPEITTIVQNFNNKRTSMVLGDKNTTLYGRGFIYDELCGYKFKISPNSFYQVNKRQTEILYKTAIEKANFKGDEILIDAYCGTGTIGLIASKKVNKVIGVELNKQAIKDAVANMKANNVKNAVFIADDAGRFMERTAKERQKIDALIMDPPRAGADFKFLNSVYKLRPKKIVYVSCGPETLKNNLNDMVKHGYKVDYIQPVDMFPFTEHVETIVCLTCK
ncbi:MAG: 23S rRNA (uracil(1939)-C(5))-methyltransferase RlmD [Erysipelotrichaceae bacterium]|nr:23S rRNA (uracil(1939)-C(5))-methyltransferase RlmD [Erysipelotrichaceae bacterium]